MLSLMAVVCLAAAPPPPMPAEASAGGTKTTGRFSRAPRASNVVPLEVGLEAAWAAQQAEPSGARAAHGEDIAAREAGNGTELAPVAAAALPESLRAVLQPKTATSAATTKAGTVPTSATWLGVTALLVAACGAAFWWGRRRVRSRALHLVEHVPLGRGRALVVVEHAQRRMLIGVGGDSFAMLHAEKITAAPSRTAADSFDAALASPFDTHLRREPELLGPDHELRQKLAMRLV